MVHTGGGKPPKDDVTAARVRELFNYSPETGEFTRIKGMWGHAAGVGVGAITSYGYVRFVIDGENYYSHRLAFLYMTGEWPKDQIDHINRIKDDNRWINLRECTHSQNQANSVPFKNNKSGFKGVYWEKERNKWISTIRCEGKKFFLGRFKDVLDATVAYNKKSKELFGEFAYINDVRK